MKSTCVKEVEKIRIYKAYKLKWKIEFDELKLSNYLHDNRDIKLSNIIFSVRSKTPDLKTLQPWKYFDNLCVLCENKAETISHFMSCNSHKNRAPRLHWETINGNNQDEQFEIALNVKKRVKVRNMRIENYEACHPQVVSDSKAPGDCWAVQSFIALHFWNILIDWLMWRLAARRGSTGAVSSSNRKHRQPAYKASCANPNVTFVPQQFWLKLILLTYLLAF